MGQCPCLAGSGSKQEQWSRTLSPDNGTGGSDPAGSGGWGHSPLRRRVLMPVLAVAVGAGSRCGEQGHCGEGGEQQALHWVLGSALRVWALCGGCLGCCGGAHGPCGSLVGRGGVVVFWGIMRSQMTRSRFSPQTLDRTDLISPLFGGVCVVGCVVGILGRFPRNDLPGLPWCLSGRTPSPFFRSPAKTAKVPLPLRQLEFCWVDCPDLLA